MERIIERFLVVVVFIVLLGRLVTYSKKMSEQERLTEVSKDSLEYYIDEDGNKAAKIEILESEKLDAFLKLGAANQTIKDLQNLVEKNKKVLSKQGNAAIIKTETIIKTVVKTEVIKDSTGITYKGFNTNKWRTVSSVSNKDTTTYDVRTYSELSLVLGLEKQGFLKKKKPYAKVSDKNPYTNIKDMRVYQVSSPKKKMFSLAPSINLGYDAYGKLVPTAGLSLQLEKVSIKF